MKDNRKPWILGLSVVTVLIFAVGYWLLHRPYGKTSEHGYKYAIALFSACNRKDDAKLQQISEMMTASLEKGELHPNEAKWLSAIIDKGLAGDWDAASHDVRRLMEDQIEKD